MTDPLERRGRDAADAVRAQAGGMDPDRGLDAVMRRGRRPRSTVVAAVVVLALALGLPAVAMLRDTGPTQLEFADEPSTPTPTPTPEPAEADEALQPEDDTEEATAPADADETPEAPETVEPEDPEEGSDADEAAEDAASGPAPIAGFGTETISGEFPPGDTVAFLTDVRVGGHDDFDRIVLEFEDDGTSAYEVGYVDPPIRTAGKGEDVDVDGEAFLEVRLFSATGVDFDRGDPYELTYQGPDRVAGATTVATEAVQTGDFEATLSWVVGLDTEAPFAVEVLEGPLRLVVDIQTP